MKKIERIKQTKDTMYVEQALKRIDEIKAMLDIPNSETVYTLDVWNGWDYFLYKDKVIVSNLYGTERKNAEQSLYIITRLCDFPETSKDIEIKTIKEGEHKYLKEDFLLWLSEPCEITESVDLSYGEVIKFLQNYQITQFKTGRYLFYAKRDNDFSWSYNIYARDLKLNLDLKIYVEMNCTLKTVYPEKIRDIYIDDLSGKLSKYQIYQCKKAFWEFIHQECKELNTNNFYALELVKQTIQPVEQDWGQFIRGVFTKDETGFAEIFVDDFPFENKPYFVLSNARINDTKKAVISFLEPNYITRGIYKNAHVKRKFWKLSDSEIKKLAGFLNMLYRPQNNEKDTKYGTNWQYLISEYNHNTGEVCEIPLPNDLVMPDYTKLNSDEKIK